MAYTAIVPVASAIIISMDLILTGYGLFHKRDIPTIINTEDFLLAGGDTEMKYLRYSLNKHKTIQHAHREANEDVWKYIVWANVLLIVAVLSMVAATIGILVTNN